ncbi:MAG: PrsW family glutamic-type intramembrane protease, partial [Anaerolineae bacterium]|nr:PrsW family glutamic-type intramembrane protease [Anaerolineae bacterium]
PGRLGGFLLGAAAGAGFALVEGVLNGALALRLDGLWAGLMIFRGAAAAMHCLASGLMGLGWQMGLIERRWPTGIGLGLVAFGLHAAWNISAGLIGLSSWQVAGPTGAWALARIGISGVLALFLMFLAMAVVIGLGWIPWRLREGGGTLN